MLCVLAYWPALIPWDVIRLYSSPGMSFRFIPACHPNALIPRTSFKHIHSFGWNPNALISWMLSECIHPPNVFVPGMSSECSPPPDVIRIFSSPGCYDTVFTSVQKSVIATVISESWNQSHFCNKSASMIWPCNSTTSIKASISSICIELYLKNEYKISIFSFGYSDRSG